MAETLPHEVVHNSVTREDEATEPIITPHVTDTAPEAQKTYTLYYKRWLILAIFSLLSLSNAMVWITFSPIASLAEKHFSVNIQWINACSLVYMIIYIPGSPIAGFLLDFLGMRIGVSIGALLNALGAWVRVAGSSSDYFVLLFIGQSLCALAQCFILSVPPKLAANWFPDSQQATSVAIGSLFNQVGIALGFFLSPLVVSHSNYHTNMPYLLIIQAVLCTAFGLFVVVGLIDRPPTPPSASAEESVRQENEILKEKMERERAEGYGEEKLSLAQRLSPFFMEMRKALRPLVNISFIILVIGFGSSQGMFYAISTVLDQLMAGMDYSPNEIGFIGVSMVLGGVVGGFTFNLIADKTGWYVFVMKTSFVGLIGTLLFFTLVMQLPVLYGIKALTFISSCLLGMMATAYVYEFIYD
jgi:MFS family permease